MLSVSMMNPNQPMRIRVRRRAMGLDRGTRAASNMIGLDFDHAEPGGREPWRLERGRSGVALRRVCAADPVADRRGSRSISASS